LANETSHEQNTHPVIPLFGEFSHSDDYGASNIIKKFNENEMKIKIPLQIVELEDDNFHLVVQSVFDDKTTGFWVVDTGASKTVFDKNLDEQYVISEEETDQLHTAGIGEKPIETTLALLKPFSLGKLNLENLKVALLDLTHINKLYSKATSLQICGLLGGDFLMKHKAVVDYKKKVLVLNTRF
jgi:hypothetical protein